mgnify:CR=1 FL=1
MMSKHDDLTPLKVGNALELASVDLASRETSTDDEGIFCLTLEGKEGFPPELMARIRRWHLNFLKHGGDSQ